jgi:hypothetical protein
MHRLHSTVHTHWIDDLAQPEVQIRRICSGSTLLGLARTVYIYTVYDRMLGDFPAKYTVYTPCTYGSGQPHTLPFASVKRKDRKDTHT